MPGARRNEFTKWVVGRPRDCGGVRHTTGELWGGGLTLFRDGCAYRGPGKA